MESFYALFIFTFKTFIGEMPTGILISFSVPLFLMFSETMYSLIHCGLFHMKLSVKKKKHVTLNLNCKSKLVNPKNINVYLSLKTFQSFLYVLYLR